MRNVVEMGIGPEKSIAEVVDGEGIRPCYAIIPGEEPREVGAVESHAADVALKVPGGEEEVPLSRVHHDGPWVGDARAQSFALGAVQFTDVEVSRVSVQPVHLAAHPVDSQALQPVTVVADHRLFCSRTVNARPELEK